jgi:serine/threonine protein kinase
MGSSVLQVGFIDHVLAENRSAGNGGVGGTGGFGAFGAIGGLSGQAPGNNAGSGGGGGNGGRGGRGQDGTPGISRDFFISPLFQGVLRIGQNSDIFGPGSGMRNNFIGNPPPNTPAVVNVAVNDPFSACANSQIKIQVQFNATTIEPILNTTQLTNNEFLLSLLPNGFVDFGIATIIQDSQVIPNRFQALLNDTVEYTVFYPFLGHHDLIVNNFTLAKFISIIQPRSFLITTPFNKNVFCGGETIKLGAEFAYLNHNASWVAFKINNSTSSTFISTEPITTPEYVLPSVEGEIEIFLEDLSPTCGKLFVKAFSTSLLPKCNVVANQETPPFSSILIGVIAGLGGTFFVILVIVALLIRRRSKSSKQNLTLSSSAMELLSPQLAQSLAKFTTIPREDSNFGSVEMESNPAPREMSPVLTNHLRIGNGDRVYELLEEIYDHEAIDLAKQEILKIQIPSGKNKTAFIFGKGCFGVLGLARNMKTQRFVAVKAVSGKTLVEATENIARSELEDSTHSKLSDLPNILPFYDSVKIENPENRLPVLYEFMGIGGLGNGEELSHILKHQKDTGALSKLEEDKIMAWVAQGMLTGLSGMHNRDYYHMDFKPSNMVITGKGEVKVIDFGCTKQFTPQECEKLKTYYSADWRYFSPERFQQMCAKDPSSNTQYSASKEDSWAAGVALLEISLNISVEHLLQKATSTQNTKELFQRILALNPVQAAELIQNTMLNVLNRKSLKPKPNLLSLISGLLHFEEKKRLSCAEALSHPLFSNKNILFYSVSEREEAFSRLQRIQDEWRSGRKGEFEVSINQEKTEGCYYSGSIVPGPGYVQSPQLYQFSENK